MKTVSALDLRKKLGGVLDSVAKRKEHVIISRANRPLAVLMPVDEYDAKVRKTDRGRRLREVSMRLEAWKSQHRRAAAGFDVVAAIREMRAGR